MKHLRRLRKERRLLEFIEERFVVEDGTMTSEHPDDWKFLAEEEKEEFDAADEQGGVKIEL